MNHPEEYRVLLRQPMGGERPDRARGERIRREFAGSPALPLSVRQGWVDPELARLFIVSEEVIRWRLKNSSFSRLDRLFAKFGQTSDRKSDSRAPE